MAADPHHDHARREGWGIGYAHGKAILIGEHSVVHGAPAIAVPLYDLSVEATIDTAEPGFLDTDIYTGPLSRTPVRLRPLLVALQHATTHFGLDRNTLRLRMRSTIPYERGLGSSAACATAVVRACANFVGQTLNHQDLFELVQAAEKVAHGTPSGLDAHTVSASSALRFQQGVVTPIDVARAHTLVIADSGVRGRTSVAVAHVRDLLARDHSRFWPKIETLATLTQRVQVALREGDTAGLGQAMNAAHTTLTELEVSSPELDHLVRAARNAGAVGAKMTGGGMGGCVISLAPSADVAYRIARGLRSAGAVRAWISSLGSVTTGSVPLKELQ